MRIHGDYHLGQVLYTGKDVAIIDFEGDRQKALSERRRKRTPLRDVAGMLYSFQLAAFTTLLDTTAVREADRALVLPWAVEWQLWVSAAFLRAYLAATEGASFTAKDREETRLLLDVFVLSKALHEVETQLRMPVKRLDAASLSLAQLLGTTSPC